jgi:hypothetical protein
MVYVIQRFTVRPFRFDPTWDNATTAGLACLEADLASVCAALPVFWPVLTTTWGRIFVTTEVSVTREAGPFHPHKHSHSASSQQNILTMITTTTTKKTAVLDCDPSSQGGNSGLPDGWEPFVGDETTGLGENVTVVEAPWEGRRKAAAGSLACWSPKRKLWRRYWTNGNKILPVSCEALVQSHCKT